MYFRLIGKRVVIKKSKGLNTHKIGYVTTYIFMHFFQYTTMYMIKEYANSSKIISFFLLFSCIQAYIKGNFVVRTNPYLNGCNKRLGALTSSYVDL